MPNHVTTSIHCIVDYSREEESGASFNNEQLNETLQEVNLCEAVMPMPDELKETSSPCDPDADLQEKYGASNWYDWCNANWGTKWGTYDAVSHDVGGDCHVVIVSFQSAWSSPSCIDKICCWLYDHYCLMPKQIIVADPYTFDTTCVDAPSVETLEETNA